MQCIMMLYHIVQIFEGQNFHGLYIPYLQMFSRIVYTAIQSYTGDIHSYETFFCTQCNRENFVPQTFI